MTHTERDPKRHIAATGLVARLRAFLPGQGSGAPASGRRVRSVSRSRRPISAVVVVLAAGFAILLLAPTLSSAGEEPIITKVEVSEVNATRATVHVGFASGTHSDWRVEYATSLNGPWSLVGTIQNEKENFRLVDVHALVPQTHYYVRVVVATTDTSNLREEEKTAEFTTTAVAAPVFYDPHPTLDTEQDHPEKFQCSEGVDVGGVFCATSNPTTTSGFGGLRTEVYADGADTNYHFEYSTSKSAVENGLGTPLPGVSGSLTAAEEYKVVEVPVDGLKPETTYYLRGVAENEKGTGTTLLEFKTHTVRPYLNSGFFAIDPTATSAVVSSRVVANTLETHWRFEYASEPSGPWSVGPEGIIPASPTTERETSVEGEVVGLSPGKSYYVRLLAENEPEAGNPAVVFSEVKSFHTSGAPGVRTFAVHALQGEAVRLLGYLEANDSGGYVTHYHFEYVLQKAFEEGGWARASSTPEVLFADTGGDYVGQDLSGLVGGEEYRYRLTASNTTPGDPVVHGAEQTLTAPRVPQTGSGASCPNEAFRVGPSAALPDCRAYEQVTPRDKKGAMQPFRFAAELGVQGAAVGEDGNHLMISEELTHWRTGSTDGGSPYFFTRTPGGTWQMTAATPQPAAGISDYIPNLFDPDLTSFAFSSSWSTGASVRSPNVELMTGQPGGPYTLVASVPRGEIGGREGEYLGWVGASEDFSKLIAGVEDRTLAGHRTATKEGLDLYEYAGGALRQTNVLSGGATVGKCGARLATGLDLSSHGTSNRSAVSADGSRVFFEADPETNPSGCPTEYEFVVGSPKLNLYVRVNGSETVDLGAYKFLAASPEGTKLLVENSSTHEVLGYDMVTMATKAPSAAEHATATELYALGIPYQLDPENALERGRYTYYQGGPSGKQIMRYDSAEKVIECVSCASPFDPEPKQEASMGSVELEFSARFNSRDGTPSETFFSRNGDYVFFATSSALVPQDVNGEVPEFSLVSVQTPSRDVYEWRGPGVSGCAAVRGCVSLISSGGEGGLVYLLGSANEGHDVFFTTQAKLGPNDNDVALDVYDARIEGGEPPLAARPVECEGDACSTPPATPLDLTPASLTFNGIGEVLPATSVAPNAKAKAKAKKKTTGKKTMHRTTRKKHRGRTALKTGKSNRRKGR